MNPAVLVSLPFLGLLLGGFGTFIGAGGGFLFVPMLLLLYPGEAPGALAAISLFAVVINSLSGAVAYGRLRRIDYKAGVILVIGMTPSAILGALTTRYLSRDLFQLAFGFLFIALAVYLFFLPGRASLSPNMAVGKGVRSLTDSAGRIFTYRIYYSYSIAVGFVIGFLGGLLGVGGGPFLVASMVGFLGFPAQVATGTSQFSLVLSTLAAVTTHLSDVSLRDVWLRAVLLAVGAVVGAQVGARLSYRSGSRLVVRALAVAILVVGAWLIQAAL